MPGVDEAGTEELMGSPAEPGRACLVPLGGVSKGSDVTATAAAAAAKSLQSRPTLCNPTDGSPPGSPVPEILQARTLEWVAFPSPMQESEK